MSSQLSAPTGGHDSRAASLVVVTWTLTGLALIIVGLRIFGRYRLARNAGRDDVFILIAMFFSLFYTIMCTAAAAAGNGKHAYDLTLPQLSQAIKINSVALIPGVMAISTPKLAVACLLIRLLNPSKFQRRVMYLLSISCIIFAGLCPVFLFVQCSPSRGLWDPTAKPVCWKPSILINYTIFTGAYSAFVDLYLAIYPVTVLRNLQIDRNKKIGLCFVFSLGFSACVVAIYKCTRLPALGDHADYTYATTGLLIWTSVESNVIIIAACLPTLRPIFRFVTGKRTTVNGRSTPSNPKNNYWMNSISKNSHKVDAEQVPADTESIERILPPSRIRRTFDVTVHYQPQDGKEVHNYGDVSDAGHDHETSSKSLKTSRV